MFILDHNFWTSMGHINQHTNLATSWDNLLQLTVAFCNDQNVEDGELSHNAIASTENVTAQHKICPSSAIDDRPGRDLFGVLKRPSISQPHTLGLVPMGRQ